MLTGATITGSTPRGIPRDSPVSLRIVWAPCGYTRGMDDATSQPQDPTTNGDGETDKERLERNFGDLLQELRVAQAGVQILFAFLLSMVFTARFDGVDAFEKAAYLVALLAAAVAAVLIIAPVAYHRALFRMGRKAELVRSAHRMASGGLFFLFVAMVSSLLLVVDVILPRVLAILFAGVIGCFCVLLWGILPLWRRAESNGATE